jgi:hypothetical protein
MGLDISFNRKQALQAGLKVKLMRNGSAEDIAIQEASQYDDPEYLAWLKREEEVIEIPSGELNLWGQHRYTDSGSSPDQENFCIRANKSGSIYEPLTNWLKANNIEWSEG